MTNTEETAVSNKTQFSIARLILQDVAYDSETDEETSTALRTMIAALKTLESGCSMKFSVRKDRKAKS